MKPFLGLLRNLLRWTEDPRLCLRGVCMRWLAQSAERALHWWLPAHQTSQSEKPNTSALLIPYHRLVLDQGRVQSSYRETVAPGLWAQRSPGDHGQHAHAGGGLGQADPCQGMQWVASQNMQWPSTKSQAERAFCLVPQKQPQGPEWSHSSVPRMSWKETLTCGLTAPRAGERRDSFPRVPWLHPHHSAVYPSSGADRLWKKSAQWHPGVQAAGQPPQWLQPQHLEPQPNLTTASHWTWMNTAEKGMQASAASGWSRLCLYRWCLGLLWHHGSYLLHRSPSFGQGMHSRASLIQPTHRGSTPTAGERTLPWTGQWHLGQRWSLDSHPAWVLNTPTPVTHQGDNVQYTLRKEIADIHTKISPHIENSGHTAIQRCSHIKTLLQDRNR